MTIGAILQTKGGDVLSVEGGTVVRDVISMLAQRRIGCVPVLLDGNVAGIFSERDVIYRLGSEGVSMLDRPVSEVMTSPAVLTGSDTTVLAALSMMTKRRIRHLPVVDGDALVGFVSIGDLVKYRIDRIESEAAAMRNYIQSA